MTDTATWHLIETAPHDGRPVELGWLPDGVVEHKVIAAWVDGHWSDYWTPTHWRELRRQCETPDIGESE